MASFNLLLNALKVHELLLRSRPGVKLSKADLSRRAEISEKQVDSCLEFLRKMGHPVAWDDIRWHYSEASEGELNLMTLVPRFKSLPSKNIALLLMIQQGMESLKGTPFWGEVKKFFNEQEEAGLSIIDSHLNEIFSFRRRQVEWKDNDSFKTVAEAVYAKKQITFFYTKMAHPNGEQRIVNPYHLVCMDAIWYLLGFDIKRQGMRTFALTRIERATFTGETFPTPGPGIVQRTLRDAFGLIGRKKDAPLHRVRLQFDAYAATRIRERRWHDSQERNPLSDGGIELIFELAELSEVLEWILSWGEHVRVCEPPELIERLQNRLRSTLALYP